jgi:hypothetical protein
LFVCIAFCTAACLGQLTFIDITLETGTGSRTSKDELGSHGIMFTDVNEDGLPDLYITIIFDKPILDLLFRNLANNTFAEDGISRRVTDFV